MKLMTQAKSYRAALALDIVLGVIVLTQIVSFVSFWISLRQPDELRPRAGAAGQAQAQTADVDDYQAIVDRSLFGKAPERPSPGARTSPLTLRGVLGNKAILYSASSKKSELIEVGGEFEGATLKEIGLDSVKVERDGTTEELKLFLPKPSSDQGRGPPGKPPDGPPPAPASGEQPSGAPKESQPPVAPENASAGAVRTIRLSGEQVVPEIQDGGENRILILSSPDEARSSETVTITVRKGQ